MHRQSIWQITVNSIHRAWPMRGFVGVRIGCSGL